MKKPWFRQKKYGYGWGLPVRWQGWVVLFGYIAFLMYARIDSHSYSFSGALLNFIPQFIFASVVLFFIVRITSGKPKWRWGNKES